MILRFYKDSRGAGECRSCKKAIVWVLLVSGKKHPLDAPIKGATIVDATERRKIEEIDTDVSSSHFATCPQSRQWSRKPQPKDPR